MKFIQNLSIKYKAYLLVGIGIITAILLLVITNVGLSSIKSKLDELVLSTNVERYAYLTILEEKIIY
jgi:methyl-accepting chemotaxis protein